MAALDRAVRRGARRARQGGGGRPHARREARLGSPRHRAGCPLRRPRRKPGREVRRRRVARLSGSRDGGPEGARSRRARATAAARQAEDHGSARRSVEGCRRVVGAATLRQLSRGRLLGYDRSGAPPPETLPGAPLNPWTLPNAIGFIRLGLIPVFLVLALSSGDGRDAQASIIYAVIGGTDYLDGMAARLTGQYSRLGVLLDPVVDRMLVISGVIVTW